MLKLLILRALSTILLSFSPLFGILKAQEGNKVNSGDSEIFKSMIERQGKCRIQKHRPPLNKFSKTISELLLQPITKDQRKVGKADFTADLEKFRVRFDCNGKILLPFPIYEKAASTVYKVLGPKNIKAEDNWKFVIVLTDQGPEMRAANKSLYRPEIPGRSLHHPTLAGGNKISQDQIIFNSVWTAGVVKLDEKSGHIFLKIDSGNYELDEKENDEKRKRQRQEHVQKLKTFLESKGMKLPRDPHGHANEQKGTLMIE